MAGATAISLAFFLAVRAVGAQSAYVVPKSINATTGSVSNGDALLAPNTSVTTLSGKGAQIVLDYGVNVGGFPTFWLASVEGEGVQMAATYSEGFGGIWSAEGDDFVDYSNGYSNNRTITYNLTATNNNTVQDYYLQGSQRWQRIWLLTDGNVSLSAVGFLPITDTTPVDSLPGGFKSSNDLFTDIWEAGARTVQLVSDPAGSIPPNWILQDDGALIPPQHASWNLYGTLWTNYTLEFQAKITGGGIGWQVLESGGLGLQFQLNETHIGLFYGYGPVADRVPDFSGLYSYPLAATALPNLTLFDGDFHQFTTVMLNTTFGVLVDGVSILNYTVPEANVSTMVVPGSFGFGGAFDAEGVFTGVRVTDTLNGTLLYESDLKNETALADFKVQTNLVDSILDGARRDRIAWIGDVAITAPSLFYSTAEAKYVTGSLALVSSWQSDTGALASDVPPITPFGDSYPVKPSAFFYSLPYEIFGIQAFYDTYMYTGNISFIDEFWGNIQAQTDRLLGLMGSNDSLIRIDTSNSKLGNDWDWYDGPRYGAGTKLNSQAVLAFNQTSVMAAALNLTSLAATYANASIAMRDAINSNLWNATGGFYVNTDIVPGVAQDANSWAIIAGVADAENRTEATLTAMSENLKTDYGMLAFSADAGSRANISPFITGFHLEALLASDMRDEDVLYILEKTFGTMVDTSRENYTGTFWEVMSPEGGPGLDAYTSLCHGWSSAPTALFSRFVLGVQPTSPGFETWIVAPQPLNTTSAEGRVSTPFGTLSVNWTISDGVMTVEVDSPGGTNGTVYVTAGSGNAVTVDGGNSTTVLLDRVGRLGVNVEGGARHVVQIA